MRGFLGSMRLKNRYSGMKNILPMAATWEIGGFLSLVFLCFTLTLTGCAPGLGNMISLPTVQPDGQRQMSQPAPVRLRPFVDVRPTQSLISIEGRTLRSDRDVGELVEAGFRNYARQAGMLVDSERGGIVSIRVLEWHANVLPSFPASTIDAQITLELALWGERGNLAFRSEYQGTTKYQHPFLGEDRIIWALNDCLNYALKEIFSDDRLLRKLQELASQS